jgi:hypothetical protein
VSFVRLKCLYHYFAAVLGRLTEVDYTGVVDAIATNGVVTCELRVLVPRCETLAQHADFLAAAPIVAIFRVRSPLVESGPAFNKVSACRFIARDEYIVAHAASEVIGGMVSPQRTIDDFIVIRTAVDVVGATLAVQYVVAA